MPKTIALVGAFDTKGPEYEFVRQQVLAAGCKALLVDVGVLGGSDLPVDVPASEVAKAGGADLAELAAKQDRGEAVAAMSRGIAAVLPKLHAEGRFDGVIALGGSGGTSVACAGMRALPLGPPKVMVSTVAGGDVSGYVGASDIVMVPSLVDVAGVNRISRRVFAQAAAAVCGMAGAESPQSAGDKPLVAASMFGNTTKAVGRARAILEEAGYEVLVFHCTGAGGRLMEKLVASGAIAGVLDITTTEWADQVVGGVFDAGPDRCGAAARAGVPAIVVPGCIDMVNFWAPDTVPAKHDGRAFYPHNPNVTLMRTTVEENREMAKRMAALLRGSKGPLTILFPRKGVSVIDSEGGPFWQPEADLAWLETIKAELGGKFPIIEMDANINDDAFADACAKALLDNIAAAKAAG